MDVTDFNSNVHTFNEARQALERIRKKISFLVKNNLSATTNPTINDDANDGYAIGSHWINTVLHRIYELDNPAVGAANWILLAPEGGTGPADAQYLVGAAHADLSSERVVTDTASITWDLATAGQAKANARTVVDGKGTYANNAVAAQVGLDVKMGFNVPFFSLDTPVAIL